MPPVRYRRRFSRAGFYREWMAGRALRRRVPDFSHERPMVSIIGDELSDVIRAEQIYERDILELLRDRVFDLEKCGKQVAVDVGANIGNHSMFLSDIFERVIAFEPNPLARSLLEMNIGLNNVTSIAVMPVGLSDRRGTATLEFDAVNLGAASSSELREQNPIARRSTIDLLTGDEAVGRSEPVGFVKVDVEGAEEAALKGLEQTLRTHAPIVMIEQWPEVIEPSTGLSPSLSFLIGLGYSAWVIEKMFPFRGRIGKLPTLLLGHVDYSLRPITRLEQREYPALIFTPAGYKFPAER